MASKQRKRINISRTMSDEIMTASDMQAIEAILAKLIARAFVADHPELFGPLLNCAIGGSINDK